MLGREEYDEGYSIGYKLQTLCYMPLNPTGPLSVFSQIYLTIADQFLALEFYSAFFISRDLHVSMFKQDVLHKALLAKEKKNSSQLKAGLQ